MIGLVKQIKNNFIFLVLIYSTLISCNKGLKTHHKMCIPEELELGKFVYGEVQSFWFGPPGLDYGLNVYQISDKTITKIKNGSLLKPTFPHFKEHWVEIYKGENIPKKHILRMRKFDNWKKTPILKKKSKFIRKSYFKNGKDYCTLDDFYGKNLSSLKINIPDDIVYKVNNAINSNNSLYSFGGLYDKSVLLISVDDKLVVYLYRN